MSFDARPFLAGLGTAALLMVIYDLNFAKMVDAQIQALVFIGAGVWYRAVKR